MKPTQKMLAYKLLKQNRDKWLPAWFFVGEKWIDGRWYLLSYKVPTRLSELWQEGLVERRKRTGKSGSRYYEYRYKPPIRFEETKDGYKQGVFL